MSVVSQQPAQVRVVGMAVELLVIQPLVQLLALVVMPVVVVVHLIFE
jgi:hypothetical protein